MRMNIYTYTKANTHFVVIVEISIGIGTFV